MTQESPDQSDEKLDFWRGWSGLYAFVLIYAVVQIALLYLFTVLFNRL